METVLGWVTQYGSISLFFLMMLGIVGLPVPDETLLVFSGFLIYKGTLDPTFTFSMAFLGSATGITVSYFLGRIYGLKLIQKYGRYFHLTEERYQKVHAWFEKVGRWSLFFGYYVGDKWESASAQLHHYLLEVCLALGVALALYLLVRWFQNRKRS